MDTINVTDTSLVKTVCRQNIAQLILGCILLLCRCGVLLQRQISVFCLSVNRSFCHNLEPCKNGWYDRDDV